MIRGEAHVEGHVVSVKPRPRKRFMPGQLIMRVKPAAVAVPAANALAFTPSNAKTVPQPVGAILDHLRENAGLRSVAPVFSTRGEHLERTPLRGSDKARLAVLSSVAHGPSEGLEGVNVLEMDPKRLTPALIKHLQASSVVDLVERMPARWLQAVPKADPLRNRQWGLRVINWFSTGSVEADAVTVAILDTGVDEDHPDLRGVVDAYVHAGLSARDLVGHGTHMSGIVAAVTDNDRGISGIARCKLKVWKVFGDKPDPDDEEFYVDGRRYLRALREVQASGAKVLNLSIGGTEPSKTERLLFRTLKESGVLTVAAMGNEYDEGNPTEYPAAFDGVLAVGAIGENMRRASFSNTGAHIGLVAPGLNILSTLPMQASKHLEESEYAAWSGTSMATAVVAGAAAVVFGNRPSWTGAQVHKRLLATARVLPAMRKKRRTSGYGRGLLDLRRAAE